MPSGYTIIVKNRTGAPQDYAIFSSPPIVSGGASGSLWSNVLKTANHIPSNGSVHLNIASDYYAICGSTDGTPNPGTTVTIRKSVPISIGSKVGNSVSGGSTVALAVADDKRTCDLAPPTTPGQGKIGHFQLTTSGNQFTIQDAKNNNLLVGIATKDGNITTAMGSFTPYPNAAYQIQPSSVFHISAGGRFNAGSLIKIEYIGSTMAVDFNARGTNSVTLIHNDDMTFQFL